MSILKKTALTLLMSILAIPGLNAARSGYTSTALRATRTQTLLNALKYYGGHALAFLLPAGGTYKALKGVVTPQDVRNRARATMDKYKSIHYRASASPQHDPVLAVPQLPSLGERLDQFRIGSYELDALLESPSLAHAREAILDAYQTARMTDDQLQYEITVKTAGVAALVGLTCMMLYNWYYETHKDPMARRYQ